MTGTMTACVKTDPIGHRSFDQILIKEGEGIFRSPKLCLANWDLSGTHIDIADQFIVKDHQCRKKCEDILRNC